MKSFFHNMQSLFPGKMIAGASVTGNPAGIKKGIILSFLFFFLLVSALYGQGGVVHTRSFVHDGVLRQYLLYVPAAYNTQEGDWPLVINYHGWTSNATAQMSIHSKMNFVADTAHFLVAYPQGLQIFIPGFGQGAGWNLPGYIATQDDISFTDSLLDHIDADYSIDLARIHATGWSNGCQFSFYLAHRLPDRFASVGGVSGPMTYELLDSLNAAPGRPFSALLMHGTADGLVPYTGVPGLITPAPATASYWASRNNCSPDSIVTDLPDIVANDNSTVTLIEYVDCDDDTEVLLYRINNGGHGWPGTGPNVFGPTNMDINASSEIWNFFKRNPMPACTPGLSGDVTGDELVNSTDGLVILSYDAALNIPQPFLDRINIGFADVNDDALTNSTDALVLLSWEAGLPVPFPVGQPVCLPDATALAAEKLPANSPAHLAKEGKEILVSAEFENNRLTAGQIIEIPVVIDVSEVGKKLGSFTGKLEWNPAALEFLGYRGGSAKGFENPVVNDTRAGGGELHFANANPYGGEGRVNVLAVRFKALKNTPANISLDFSAMAAAETFIDLLPSLEKSGENSTLSADGEDSLPQTFAMNNYPNPFNPATMIRYSVLKSSRVELKIYNALGQLVKTLVDGFQTTGEYSAVWDGKDSNGNLLTSGIYFYRIQMGEFSAVRKMTYLK